MKKIVFLFNLHSFYNFLHNYIVRGKFFFNGPVDDVPIPKIKATVNHVYQFITGSTVPPLDTTFHGRAYSSHGEKSVGVEFFEYSASIKYHPTVQSCIPTLTLPKTTRKEFIARWIDALENCEGFWFA